MHMVNNEMFYILKNNVDQNNEITGQAIMAVNVNYSFYFKQEVYVNVFKNSNERITGFNLD
jgi:hypothetical protein